ncbi:hypothetical protein [Paraburkholderia youngii]|uniref:hypothetical protein n=1 Tax=Paraburkholderia youngii TaxID=2782701 RepID=UPI003D23C900
MMKLLLRSFAVSALATAGLAAHLAMAQVGAATESVDQYIARVYGDNNEFARAAHAYADALDKLWTRTATTQQYQEELQVAALHAQYCLQAKLDRIAPAKTKTLITDLKRTLAGNPVGFTGYLFSEQLLGQRELPVVPDSERVDCSIAGVK